MLELSAVCLDHPRGGAPLVSDANLAVARGEVVMIVGAAGVGTSRLVAAALGEVAVTSGRVEVLGRDVAKLRRSSLRLLRRRVGIVPQDLCLLDDRSAQLNVALPLEIDGVPRSTTILRATEALHRLGLEHEASLPIDCPSGAERQRVAVARALVRDPELVLADHATSMQDAEGAELVAAALAEAAAAGAAVVAFGRDLALRAIAERRGWRTLGLVRGALRPLGEIQLEGKTIDELLVDITSAPVRTPEPSPEPVESIPNVVPFPLSARTAGVA
ncbi:MAG TPA: ATP-binding cassette domain-containing protein [Kofleriaceae bacterium]|nr:ATP-binding cassette domain-containing protein [Kofleriaceae bacterium]